MEMGFSTLILYPPPTIHQCVLGGGQRPPLPTQDNTHSAAIEPCFEAEIFGGMSTERSAVDPTGTEFLPPSWQDPGLRGVLATGVLGPPRLLSSQHSPF